MSVLRKETAANKFAETQLVRIIVYVEMDIIFIKMKKLAWVGNVFFLHQDEKACLGNGVLFLKISFYFL